MDITEHNDHELFDININAINFYAKGNKVIPIECHEFNFIIDLLKQNNISEFKDDIKNNIADIIYDNMGYIKEELLKKIDDPDIYYFFNIDKQKLNSLIDEFVLLYKSMSVNGYIDNISNPILISRIKLNDKNILCLINGELRLFIAKILGFKKIKALIGDAGPDKRYLYYEYK